MTAAVLPFTGRASHGLTEAELAEVQANLTEVVASLRQQRALDRRARGYLDAIIAELIEIVDDLDGDPDLEPCMAADECEEACEDEGAWDDCEPDDEVA